ncbi:uncharacterized protein LOC62_03G005141 [Vanrija pseudolonga]|uniref:Uncharacterized protein n=1 Tax=Vanrija pseudolonga TaxID=143232 RepID=A0AAF0Y7G8_9TREE|nr:hypothetical protein LOC62_03G005141 [Vanrija pseudolonga]
MPSHKHKRERSRSHSRPRARDEVRSSPSSPPLEASKTRRGSRAYREPNDDSKYGKRAHDEDKYHRSRRRRYSSEASEEAYTPRRWSREDEHRDRDRDRERSRPSRRYEGRQSGLTEGLPSLSNEQFAQLLAGLQRSAQSAASQLTAHATAVPVTPFKVEPPTGLVRAPREEEKEEDWDKINQEADDILNDLEDEVQELLTKVPDSTTQLKDLPPMFDALIDVFNGLAIGQQTDILLKTHKETREKIAQLLASAHDKAVVIQAKAAEEIAKIAPAEEERVRLIAEAREDFTKILAAQDAQLAGLRKDLDRVEAKAFKEVVKLPTAEDIKKAARREAYRTMAEKL